MSSLRLMFGLPIAAVITIGLFLGMNSLVSTEGKISPERQIYDPVINADIPEPDAPPAPIDERAPIIDDRIVPDRVDVTPTTDGDRPVFRDENPAPAPDPGPIVNPGAVLTPIITIEPIYPERCASRGIEGHVLVEFDVTGDGAVTNARILSSTSRCLNKSAIAAVTRWRYSPTGTVHRGQKVTLTFQLAAE